MLTTKQISATTYTNDLEIRVFGMRRSGNHGIINWIGSQAPYMPHYFNCASDRGHSPFRTGKGTKDVANIWQPHKSYKHSSEDEINELAQTHKEVLIYNYEDLDIDRLKKEEFPTDREKILGKSKRRVDVLIMRDFANWMASKLLVPKRYMQGEVKNFKFQNMTMPRFEKNRRELPYFNFYDGWEEDAFSIRGLNYIRTPKTIRSWMNYAREMVGETTILENAILINYNKWHFVIGYRKEIIEELGFEFTDKGKDVIALAGRGSTFQSQDEKASNLDILNRWKHLKSNRIFKDLVRYYPDVLKYNNDIFGENEELAEWLAK